MHEIVLPASPKEMKKLKLGEEILLTGRIVTARDAAHKYLVEERPAEFRELLKGVFLYHCGPVMKKEGAHWRVVAAGPTTSIREEPYEAAVIREYGIAGAIGKGGMGEATLAALRKYGAVYLHAVGGLAAILAECVKKVEGVYKLEEFGVPEAMWVFEVERFPCIVTMDARGHSLHREVEKKSQQRLQKLLEL